MCNSKISKLEEEQQNMKLKMTEMMNLLKEHLVGGKVTPSEGQSRNVPQSNNIQSPKSIALEKRHNFTEGKNACYLLDWANRPPPVPSWDASKEEHEKYADWMRTNHMARFYCLGTMEEKLRKKFEHIEYACDWWDATFKDLQTRPQSRKM
ncbi:uncharacterized protein LOC133805805 [Humulus lupulus]|uniref:uncharacterized protein LOC133805805 n=1 Tax=Humulus lupulus TaxID=3486 RepID=UPI002B4065F9|nr:uncharacterized protein LOC133805805 [Humulus lupulus]